MDLTTHLMTTDPRKIPIDALKRFIQNIFTAEGMSGGHAATMADVLSWANLRGVDSHGISRIPRYVGMIDNGGMNPHPNISVTTETSASLSIEADRAAGPVAMDWAMDKAIAKARNAGIGWAMVRQMTHSGAIGYYTLKAARADMAGLAFVSSLPNMAYPGTRAGSVGTSPIGIAVPGGDHAPLMLDMATAVVAGGRLAQARLSGEIIPEGWALDADGVPTTDGARAVTSVPLGGHKGGGLSLMLECLISLMVGNPILAAELQERTPGHPIRQNGLCIAVNIAAFTDPAEFRAQVDRLVETLKSLDRAEGTEEILVPGERGDRVLEERTRSGIPVRDGIWTQLETVAARHGVAMPESATSTG
jgi:LDH2 family malate/lactate/ureidoglycolate dehydrogenase